MYNFGYIQSLGFEIAKLDELIEEFELNNDVVTDGFNATQLDRLITAKELVIKTRDALQEASVDD